MLNPQSPSHVYLGRIPKWLKELELTKWERKLIRSIHNGKKVNIAFYIKQVTDPQKCYNSIKKYYTKVHGLTLKTKSLDAINYKNKAHILLALVCHLSLDVSEIQTKTIFKKLNKSIIETQVQFNSVVVEPLYSSIVLSILSAKKVSGPPPASVAIIQSTTSFVGVHPGIAGL